MDDFKVMSRKKKNYLRRRSILVQHSSTCTHCAWRVAINYCLVIFGLLKPRRTRRQKFFRCCATQFSSIVTLIIGISSTQAPLAFTPNSDPKNYGFPDVYQLVSTVLKVSRNINALQNCRFSSLK